MQQYSRYLKNQVRKFLMRTADEAIFNSNIQSLVMRDKQLEKSGNQIYFTSVNSVEKMALINRNSRPEEKIIQ